LPAVFNENKRVLTPKIKRCPESSALLFIAACDYFNLYPLLDYNISRLNAFMYYANILRKNFSNYK